MRRRRSLKPKNCHQTAFSDPLSGSIRFAIRAMERSERLADLLMGFYLRALLGIFLIVVCANNCAGFPDFMT